MKIGSYLFAGVRFYVRGLDDEGNVANYVETEQLISFNGFKASFIQVCHMYVTYCTAISVSSLCTL